ncbi:MAG TPA: hypothetical protein PK529_00360 [Verrucomicrobiales bacterium]|nr:hypothetical protein [Verrucomicrobiales bacterium]
MAELHQLKRLILSRYRQFHYAEVDLIDPETGMMLSDLCLIGPNGSGKSTLLAELYLALTPGVLPVTPPRDDLADALVLARYGTDGEDLYLARPPLSNASDSLIFSTAIEQSEKWREFQKSPFTFTEFCDHFSTFLVDGPVPAGVRGKSTAWFSALVSLVDGAPADDFTTFLEKRFRERESDYHRYLKRPENREKTIAGVEQEFEAASPYVLTALKAIWETIMSSSGVQFDFSKPDAPVLADSGSSFSFSHLSPATQGLLLRLGHVFSQYFGQELHEGALFLDTPEDGLHPEISQGLIDLYRTILLMQKAPLFVATHSPLIAASFPPARRLRLKLNRDGFVTLFKGIAPDGIEPNQLLKSDFEIETTLPTPRGAASRSGRYSQLKRAIQESENQDELADLIDEVMTIRKF